jgi:glycosyltransferase involved in cell wall biosynthesis
MKKKESNLLVSIDFRPDKGGISRVAHLMAQSIEFDRIISLHGNDPGDSRITFFKSNKALFFLELLNLLFFKRYTFIMFDHINIARILSVVPGFCLKKVGLFLYDEEAWCKVVSFRRIALEKASVLLCISDYTRKRFISSNPEFASKTRLCLLAGVPSQFSLEAKSNSAFDHWINDKRPFLLFVSRLWKVHRYKGYLELLEAFRLHYGEHKNAFMRLAIIGNGDDEPVLRSFIADHGLEEHIRIFTKVEDSDLKKFYKSSLGLIFPSIREGFGLVFLEAMFFGKCCIGILDQPAEEIIIQGKTGVLLPENKPEYLKKVIEDFENDPDKYKRMGEEGYLHYMNYFRNEHFKQRFLQALKS